MIKKEYVVLFVSGILLLAESSHLGAADSVVPDLDAGRRVFGTTCIVCHGSNGKGAVPGTPDFTRSDSRLLKDMETLARNVRDGLQTPGNPLAMPPKGGNPNISEADIRNTIAWMREQFLPEEFAGD